MGRLTETIRKILCVFTSFELAVAKTDFLKDTSHVISPVMLKMFMKTNL